MAQPGGGGGGAVQLISLDKISFTMNGSVDVGGGGGTQAAGGGSGGVVVLEAPTIEFTAAGTGVTANGGAGGGCQMSGPDAQAGSAAAMGPKCAPYSAGDGGTAAVAPGDGGQCTGTCVEAFFGGGGGAVGQLRIATRDGMYTNNGAVLSAEITTSALTAK